MNTEINPDNVMLLKDWLNIAAILLSAVAVVAAVFITNMLNRREQRRESKIDIFRTLMLTRVNKLSQEHVSALNAIEIEFNDCKIVMEAWNKYFENLSSDSTPEKRNRLFAKLVAEIAKTLNMRIEQLDILNENYLPQGWINDLEEQRLLRQLLIGLLNPNSSAKIAVPVKVTESNIIELPKKNDV